MTRSNLTDIEVQFQHQTDGAVCIREVENGPDIMRTRAIELLCYDAETGHMVWRVTRSRTKSGSVAGYIHKASGYRYVGIDRNLYLAHRLIWLMTYGHWPKSEIDHIDGDRANNRLENLREATPSQNRQNTKVRADNISGKTGVFWNKRLRKWGAQIQINGNSRALGHYDTTEEAAATYAHAKRRLHTFHPEVVVRKKETRQ